MGQRVRDPHRGQSPSSVTQLPILTALHARFPTLFAVIIHDSYKNVNTLSIFFYRLFYANVNVGNAFMHSEKERINPFPTTFWKNYAPSGEGA